jgi:transposase-like protein
MPGRPGLTDSEQRYIRERHEAGDSCNAIARTLGRSASTVSRYAREAGLSWDSSRTAPATEAKQASNRERRARLVSRLYDRADKIMDRLEAEQFKLVGLDKDGYARTNVVDADAIPGAEERALTGMVVNALVAAARLEQVDAGQAGNAEAKGILGNLADALQSAYGQLAHTSTPTADATREELED